MNLEKAVNHGDTADTAKNQKPVFAFASRRVAVVNGFESVYFQPGRLKIKRVSYIIPTYPLMSSGDLFPHVIPASAGMTRLK
jgi:hypothetical protein